MHSENQAQQSRVALQPEVASHASPDQPPLQTAARQAYVHAVQKQAADAPLPAPRSPADLLARSAPTHSPSPSERAYGPFVGSVQLSSASARPPTDGQVQQAAAHGISSSGSEVPYRQEMEQRFGVSFGAVQAHTNASAQEACTSMGANAYAMGSHVAFKTADPDRGLVAHELTHVVQQQGKLQPQMAVGQAGDAYEQEADAVADKVRSGESVHSVVERHTGRGAGGEASGPGQAVQRSTAKDDAKGAKPAGDGKDQKQDEKNKDGKKQDGKVGPGPKGVKSLEEVTDEGLTEKRVGSVQADKDATEFPWGGEYMSVEVKPIGSSLIGNLAPTAAGGKHQIGYNYHWREAYKGSVRAGIKGPTGSVGGPWGLGDMDANTAMIYSAGLKSTKPGAYTAYMDHPGGFALDSMSASEGFTVVDPVKIDPNPKSKKILFDFLNPIPVQMVGGSKLTFKLTKSLVQGKRTAIAASGSTSTNVTEKTSFGLKVGLDNDAGSSGSGALGFSTETQHAWQEQWSKESYHQAETTNTQWKSEDFTPKAGEKGRSKMIIPKYEWVEWNAKAYEHNPADLTVTGGQKSVVIGMLRPTGDFETQKSTDEGNHSDSKPSDHAQTDPDTSDTNLGGQYKDQMAATGGWTTLPGAKWGNTTLQFIMGPISMQPAGRDYGMQDGAKIHPDNGGEVSFGGSISISAEDGMTTSQSATTSGVTTNNESKSLEASPGIKGIGSIGSSLSFENGSSLSNSTGTGLSTAANTKEQTQVDVTHAVTKKPDTNQYILFTPLVNHKVFKVAYGAQQPTDGKTAVDPNTACTIRYVHTYKHQILPHVRVTDIAKDKTPARGRYDATHTPV